MNIQPRRRLIVTPPLSRHAVRANSRFVWLTDARNAPAGGAVCSEVSPIASGRSSVSNSSDCPSTTARSTAFSNYRTLPGHP